jgi:NitT/TauT family transport system permease protein
MFKRRVRWKHLATYAASLLAGAAAWEAVGRHTSPAFMVPLSATLVRLWEMTLSGELLALLADSLRLFGTGFCIALAVGVPLGLLMARLTLLRVALESYIVAAYATPMAALVPFILSMMGYGFAPKVLVVTLFAVFPILFNTVEGARSIKPELIEVARAFRSSERAFWLDVLLPYTLPFILTGTRQAIVRGLVGMVVAEFFLSATGLGRVIMESSRDFDLPTVFAAVLIITGLGVALVGLGRLLEQRFAAWRGLE